MSLVRMHIAQVVLALAPPLYACSSEASNPADHGTERDTPHGGGSSSTAAEGGGTGQVAKGGHGGSNANGGMSALITAGAAGATGLEHPDQIDCELQSQGCEERYNSACFQLGIVRCDESKYCTVEVMWPIDEQAGCIDSSTETQACITIARGCGGRQTAFRAPDGSPWASPSTCHFPRYSEVPELTQKILENGSCSK